MQSKIVMLSNNPKDYTFKQYIQKSISSNNSKMVKVQAILRSILYPSSSYEIGYTSNQLDKSSSYQIRYTFNQLDRVQAIR